MKYWQESMLESLVSYFRGESAVSGFFLFGSYSQPDYRPDYWSDLDILIVVQDGKLDRFFPTMEWLNSFGKIYTYSQSSDNFKYVTRICFENFNRVDFVITTEGKLAEINKWTNIPFFSGVKVVFSRSKIVDQFTAQKRFRQEFPPVEQERFIEMIHEFRFKSMLAVYKVVRGDLLIALHLTQDLISDCSVLGMMLRDKATGTNIHKHSGIGNQIVTQLEVAQKPFSASGILDSIKEGNMVFDRLAREWSSNYQESCQPLLVWIERAKTDLNL